MNWLLLIILSVFFIVTPYHTGFFFDDKFYIYESLINILLLIMIVYLCRKKKIEDSNWKIFIIYLIPATYALSLTVAETPLGAIEQFLRWTTYCSFFILSWWVGQPKKSQKNFIYTLTLTGIWITVFTLLGVYGQTDFRDILVSGRPSGIFQYPNTFAAFVGSLWLFHILLLTRMNITRLEIAYLSAPLVLYGVMFIGSLSRGAWLLLPIIWLIGILFLRLQQQLKIIILTFMNIVASFLVYRPVVVDKSDIGISYLIISSLLIMLFVLIYDKVEQSDIFKRIKKYSTKRYINFILPVIILISGLLLVADLASQGLMYQQLPNVLQKRIDSINSDETSAQGRTVFYKDAIEMNKDYPLMGLGGDGWRVLFTKYQDTPYWSNEVHNGYLEWLLSVGWLGTILIFLVFIYLFYQIGVHILKLKDANRKINTIAALIAILMLLSHSALDFNFSFGTIWIVIMWLLVIAMPNQLYTIAFLPQSKDKKNPWLKRIGLSIVIIMISFSIVYSFRFFLANKEISTIKGKDHAEIITKQLEKASMYNPYRTDILLKSAEVNVALFTKTKEQKYLEIALEQIENAEKLEPNNARLIYSIAKTYLSSNNHSDALKYLEKALDLDRFHTEYYESIMKTNLGLAYSSYVKKDVDESNRYTENTIAYYQKMKNWHEKIKGTKINQRKFTITQQARYIAGQAYYLLGDDKNVITELTPIRNTKDLMMKKRVNAYLALSYQRMNNKKKYQQIVEPMKKEFTDFEQLLKDMEKLNELK